MPHPVGQWIERHVTSQERKALAAGLDVEWARCPGNSGHRQVVEDLCTVGVHGPAILEDSVASALDNVHIPTRQQSVHSESLSRNKWDIGIYRGSAEWQPTHHTQIGDPAVR